LASRDASIVNASERFDRSSHERLRDANEPARRAAGHRERNSSAITGRASPLRGSDTHTSDQLTDKSTSAYSSPNHKAVLRRPLEPGQYVSLAFGQAARDAGIARSMGSKGDCYDNAVAESFFATLKKELVHRRSWPTRRELTSEVFEYIEAFYNRTRRHSTLGMLSPADYENRTLIDPGASLAASRLAYPDQEIK